jgi:hypothetical protein
VVGFPCRSPRLLARPARTIRAEIGRATSLPSVRPEVNHGVFARSGRPLGRGRCASQRCEIDRRRRRCAGRGPQWCQLRQFRDISSARSAAPDLAQDALTSAVRRSATLADAAESDASADRDGLNVVPRGGALDRSAACLGVRLESPEVVVRSTVYPGWASVDPSATSASRCRRKRSSSGYTWCRSSDLGVRAAVWTSRTSAPPPSGRPSFDRADVHRWVVLAGSAEWARTDCGLGGSGQRGRVGLSVSSRPGPSRPPTRNRTLRTGRATWARGTPGGGGTRAVVVSHLHEAQRDCCRGVTGSNQVLSLARSGAPRADSSRNSSVPDGRQITSDRSANRCRHRRAPCGPGAMFCGLRLGRSRRWAPTGSPGRPGKRPGVSRPCRRDRRRGAGSRPARRSSSAAWAIHCSVRAGSVSSLTGGRGGSMRSGAGL